MLFITAFIILSLSLDTMMRVKDLALYDAWYTDMVGEIELGYDQSFSIYVTGNLAAYFFNVVIPMAFGVHTFFAYKKIRINGLFVFIWLVLLTGSALYVLMTFAFSSIFYYSTLLGYFFLILTVLSLTSIINETKKR